MSQPQTRQPVSKKMRFDVFKRDNFACIYCGQHPPKVVLEADHVVPVFEGGKNRMDNLVTACFDCNRGKGKHSLSAIPESLSSKAERIKETELQLKAYRKILDKKAERLATDAWDVIHELFGSQKNEIAKSQFNSILKFVDLMDLSDVLDSARYALRKKPHQEADRFVYFCGVCWGKIKEGSK